MSKLYDQYLELKLKNKHDLYLFKSGMFYIFLDEDAKIAAEKLNLKLTALNDTILKCGFPVNSLMKYTQLLKEQEINYQIIDGVLVDTKLQYIEKQNVQNLLSQIKKIDINQLSPLKAFEILSNLQNALRR